MIPDVPRPAPCQQPYSDAALQVSVEDDLTFRFLED